MEPKTNQEDQQSAATQPVVPTEPQVPVVPQAPAATKPVEPLPDVASQRAKEQFDKLLESNRRLYQANELLRQEMDQKRTNQQVFDPLRNPAQQQEVDFVEVNPLTGDRYIDEKRLKARLEDATSKVSKLETAMQSYVRASETREAERQNREAYAVYPELDPYSGKFDSDFNKSVRGTLMDAFQNPQDYGGRPFSFREAADYAKGRFGKVSQPTQTQQQQQQADAQAQAAAADAQKRKEQAGAQAQSQPGNQARTSETDEQELKSLIYKTRYLNDDAALAERIKHTEHILPLGAREAKS